MFSFGKKKISEKVIVDSFVRALIDDMKEAYPWIIDQLNEIPGTNDYLKLPENANDIITISVLSLEIIALPNLFKNDQAKRIKELSINLFAEYQEFNKDYLYSEIESYERSFNEHAEAGLNPALAVSESLYKNLGIKNFESQNFRGLSAPDPILVTGLSAILVSLCGRWKQLKDNFKIIKSN